LGIFDSLPPEDRAAILDPKGTNKMPPKAVNVNDRKKSEDLTNEDKLPSRSSKGKQHRETENEDNDAVKSFRCESSRPFTKRVAENRFKSR